MAQPPIIDLSSLYRPPTQGTAPSSQRITSGIGMGNLLNDMGALFAGVPVSGTATAPAPGAFPTAAAPPIISQQAVSPQAPQETGGVPGASATGAPPGQSFSEGATSGLTGGGTFSAGNIGRSLATTGLNFAGTALGVPVPVMAPLTAALGLESGLKQATTLAPNLSVKLGLLPGVQGNIRGDIAAQRAGERAVVPVSAPRSGGDDTGSVTGGPAPQGAPAAPSQSMDIGLAPAPNQPQQTVASELTSTLPSEASLFSEGVAGPPGTGPNTAAGEAATGFPGEGEGSGAGSSGGGGGGGGDGGGCFLATFGMEALSPRERERAKAFFGDFRRLYFASNPRNGRQLFAKYQAIAKRIIDAIRRAGKEKQEQKFIYEHLIKPTGAHVEKNEIPEAVRNLTSVVTTLAKRYKIPLPARSTDSGK